MNSPVNAVQEKEGGSNGQPSLKTGPVGSRRKSREAALQALFFFEMNPQTPFERSLEVFLEHFPVKAGSRPFFHRLVQGVGEHLAEIDRIIKGHSENWRLERMSRVDRNILRIAVFEIVYCTDIPPRVAINEAIDLGKLFGTEESGAFINGILDGIFLEQHGTTNSEEIETPADERKI
jgi:transcription antitermination protein NusB